MGILNTTPDSFYDGGRYVLPGGAVERAVQMVEEGADIIDIGGERAAPGEPVSVHEEMRRVIPVVAELRREIDVPISVDTFKPEVARAAMDAGADIVNSIGGFSDPAMRRVAADTGAAVVVMHIQGSPRVANPQPQYDDVVREVVAFLDERVRDCLNDGIAVDHILVDPGPDFGKTTGHSLKVIRHLRTLTGGRYPVLLAASRKRFIGEVLGVRVDDRLEGSLAVAAWGVLQGVKFIRTHDVRATKRVVTMIEAVFDPSRTAAQKP